MRSQKVLLKTPETALSALTLGSLSKRQATVYRDLPDQPIALADALRLLRTTRATIDKLAGMGVLSLRKSVR